MNSQERIIAAFQGKQPDRVPVVFRLSLDLIRQRIPRQMRLLDVFRRWVKNPLDAESSVIRLQEEFGLDPIVVTASQHVGEWESWPRALFGYPPDAIQTWREKSSVVLGATNSQALSIRRVIETPKGELSYAYQVKGGSCWPSEYLVKEEHDIELLQYRPDPMQIDIDVLKSMVEQVRQRVFFRHAFSAVWNEASELRGPVNLAMDIYERPAWVKELLEIVKRRQLRHVRRLAQTGIHSIAYMQDWMGMGVSPAVYDEFIGPYDQEVIQTAHDAGLLVTYHVCGRGAALLEQIVSSGPDALETLTPREKSGDFDLADCKARVGDRICLFGGFDERVLSEDSQKVRAEAKRCLDAAMAGGGYILHGTGLLYSAKPENMQVLIETVQEHGTYLH
jgi:uroporphyrinogen decarboxylase